jgi:hypothetical protein
MAQDFGVVVGGDRKVELLFDKFPQQLHGQLLEHITAKTKELEARVHGAVPKKTGKLASEIDSAVFDDKNKITGAVFVSGDYAKAGALEYGAHATSKVKAHSAKLDHVFSLRLDAPMTVAVSAHTRQMDIAAQKFLRGSFQQMEQEIEADLRTVVDQTIEATA